MAKIGRNAACPCGSGQKYKRCCGSIRPSTVGVSNSPPKALLEFVERVLKKRQANEVIRGRQQGLGRPIVSGMFTGYRFVLVGSKLHYSKSWKTFHDFLLGYIKVFLGETWGNAELSKPYGDRHIVLKWYDEVYRLQRAIIREPGKVASGAMTAAVSCYLRLAYNLYLIAHNTKNDEFDQSVQRKLIRRLRDPEAFPGAYYEAEVFAALIKAGFEIEFEDESGRLGKRCEARVRCKSTGKQYSLEAKAIRRKGSLGATRNTTAEGKPLEVSIRHQLYDAVSKVAPHHRIIFIDVNLPDDGIGEVPAWLEEGVAAVTKAESLTVSGSPTESAYIMLTNRSEQHENRSPMSRFAVALAGYKIPDFGHGKRYSSFIEQYHAKQRHLPVHRIFKSLEDHGEIPSTFDGELPSVEFGGAARPIRVGERCEIRDADGRTREAEVTSVMVREGDKTIMVGTKTGQLATQPISDEQLEDYRLYGSAMFGDARSRNYSSKNPFEFFEWLHECYSSTPKQRLLELMSDHPDYEELKTKSQEDLALIYAERCALAVVSRTPETK